MATRSTPTISMTIARAAAPPGATAGFTVTIVGAAVSVSLPPRKEDKQMMPFEL